MDQRGNERHPVVIQGRYRTGRGVPRDVLVKDLSLTGCCIFDRFSTPNPGAYISIRIGSIGPISAKVQWRNNSDVGLAFDTPLHSSVLQHMRETIDGWRG